MRSLETVEPPPLATETVDERLSVAEWFALPVSMRIAHRLSEVVVLLGIVREELRTEEGAAALPWMEDEIERAFDTTDAALQRLSF